MALGTLLPDPLMIFVNKKVSGLPLVICWETSLFSRGKVPIFSFLLGSLIYPLCFMQYNREKSGQLQAHARDLKYTCATRD